MKRMKTTCQKIQREIAAVQRGEKAPARFYQVELDAKGRVTRKELPPEVFRRDQAAA